MGAANVIGTVGRGMTFVGAAMVGAGYESAKAAITFQTAMERIHTQAQVSRGTVNQLSQAVLKLGSSGSVQYGPTELANALYHVESVASGHAVPGLTKASQAMGVLKVAAQGAAVGGANLEQTTTAVMGIMASLHMPASKAAQAMGLINTTVGIGNMRMQDLVTAIGSGVIPAFKDYGLNAKDALAAIALFADQGTAASSSARQLATALHYLTAPGKKATDMLAQLAARAGMAPMQLQLDVSRPGGLLAGVKDLHKMLAGLPQWQINELLSTIAPGGRGRVILQALNSVTQYGNKLAALNHPTVGLTKAIQAQQNTMSGRLHSAWAIIKTDMTIFGQTLIPIISHWLPKFTGLITGILHWVTSLSPQMKTLLTYMAGAFVVGGPILIGLSRLFKAWKAIRDMIYGVRAAEIAAAAAGRGAAAGGAATAAGGAGAGAGTAAGAAGAGGLAALLGRGVAGGSLRLGSLLERLGFGGAGMRVLGVGGALERIVPLLARGAGGAGLGYLGYSLLPGGIRHEMAKLSGIPQGVAAVSALLSGHAGIAAQHFLSAISGGFLGHHQGGVIKPLHLQGGGPIGVDNIPAWLQAGEGVLNTTAMSGLGVGGLGYLNAGGSIGGLGGMHINASPVYLMLDGRTIAHAVIKYTLSRGARGPSSLVGGSLAVGSSYPVQRG